ncbi:hypothetical protein LguiA_007773 [Lonicera macranthoides]
MFGDLKLQNPENREFAQMFQKNYAGKILECHLKLLNVIRVGGYLLDRVTNLILQYLSNRSVKTPVDRHLKASVVNSFWATCEFDDENEGIYNSMTRLLPHTFDQLLAKVNEYAKVEDDEALTALALDRAESGSGKKFDNTKRKRKEDQVGKVNDEGFKGVNIVFTQPIL